MLLSILEISVDLFTLLFLQEKDVQPFLGACFAVIPASFNYGGGVFRISVVLCAQIRSE